MSDRGESNAIPVTLQVNGKKYDLRIDPRTIAAAITAAVHHATSVRVRELPVKMEDLLTSSILA